MNETIPSPRKPQTRALAWQRISLALAATLLCAGCGGYVPDVSPKQPNAVSLQPQDWYVLHSSGLPRHPTSDPLGAWSIQIPSSENGGHLGYVETPFNATIPLHSITVVFDVVSSSPQFIVFDPTDYLPPTCRLMIEQKNDDGNDPNGRWWAPASVYNLGSNDGQILTRSIPLTASYWANVHAEQNAAAFAAALSNIGWVGVTFGGSHFAGHGLALTGGTAKYVLIDYIVE